MIFKSIREYVDINPECQFCGGPISTYISGEKNRVSIVNNIGFHTSIFLDLDDFIDMKGNLEFTSSEDKDNLYYQYLLNNKTRDIFSVNKDTCKIEGDLDKIQNIFWDNKLSIVRRCNNQKCKDNHLYMCGTNFLVLERKKKALFPFKLDIEGFTIDLNNNKYALSSLYDSNITWITSLGKKDLSQNLPFMNLYQMRGGENIINKFKTILLFL